jgi:hypothetical protein
MSRHYTQLPIAEDAGLLLAAQTKHLPNGGTLVVESNGKYTYAYGPPGLKGLLHNSFALRCSLFVSLGGLTLGYDQGVIANVLVMKDFVARWPIGPWEKGLMSESRFIISLLAQLTSLLFLLQTCKIPSWHSGRFGTWSSNRSPHSWHDGR